MKKKKLYLWTSDYSTKTGEGNLARMFIKFLKKKNKYSINLINKNKSIYKYFSPFYGIFFFCMFFIKKQKVGYVNYLPMWNFLIFLLLPPKTIIGPITGGANYSNTKNMNYFFRSIIFPIFYKVSEFIINIRYDNVIFSTGLLKKYLSNKTVKCCNFNFVLNHISKNKNKGKKIYDLIIYYRQHKNKHSSFPYNLVERLVKLNFKIIVVGDNLKIDKIKNYGYLSNRYVRSLQSQSKFTISSDENVYSLFVLESLSNNVKILTDKRYKNQIKFFKKKFIVTDFNNLDTFKRVLKNN